MSETFHLPHIHRLSEPERTRIVIEDETAVSTASGGYISIANPRENQINIYDIAIGLSNIPRFGGQTHRFYPVALHSILIARKLSADGHDDLALQGLMHDAAEAYLGDIQMPIKKLLPEYKLIEANMEFVIRRRFNLPQQFDPMIKQYDRRICKTEKEIVLRNYDDWPCLREFERLDVEIPELTGNALVKEFLKEFENLIDYAC